MVAPKEKHNYVVSVLEVPELDLGLELLVLSSVIGNIDVWWLQGTKIVVVMFKQRFAPNEIFCLVQISL